MLTYSILLDSSPHLERVGVFLVGGAELDCVCSIRLPTHASPHRYRSKENSRHCVLTAVVIRDAKDLARPVLVPQHKEIVAITRVVEGLLVDDVICLAGITLVCRETRGGDDCEVMPSSLKSEHVGV